MVALPEVPHAPPARPPPAPTRQPLTSVLSPFPECHGVGITGYVAFSDWCLSPSNVRLRFLRAFSWLESSFLFSREERPTVRVDHGVFAIRLL